MSYIIENSVRDGNVTHRSLNPDHVANKKIGKRMILEEPESETSSIVAPYPTIADKDELLRYLSDLLIHFDHDPKRYTKDDFRVLCTVVVRGLIAAFDNDHDLVKAWTETGLDLKAPSAQLVKTTFDTVNAAITALLAKDTSLLNLIDSLDSTKQDKLTPGTNITITTTSDATTISATDTTYTAGNGMTLTGTVFSANVLNNVTSTSTTDALSANMGKELQDEIDNLKSRGRFLALWNCITGKPATDPVTLPYTYKTGDYYIIHTIVTNSTTTTSSLYTHTINLEGNAIDYNEDSRHFTVAFTFLNSIATPYTTIAEVYGAMHALEIIGSKHLDAVGSGEGTLSTISYVSTDTDGTKLCLEDSNFIIASISSTIGSVTSLEDTVAPVVTNNYKPSGSLYDGNPSAAIEENIVNIDDIYYYDGTAWALQINTQRTVSFAGIAGSPYDNAQLNTALNSKLNTLSSATEIITIENDEIDTTAIETAFNDFAEPWTTATTLWPSGTYPTVEGQLIKKDNQLYRATRCPKLTLDFTKLTGSTITMNQIATMANEEYRMLWDSECEYHSEGDGSYHVFYTEDLNSSIAYDVVANEGFVIPSTAEYISDYSTSFYIKTESRGFLFPNRFNPLYIDKVTLTVKLKDDTDCSGLKNILHIDADDYSEDDSGKLYTQLEWDSSGVGKSITITIDKDHLWDYSIPEEVAINPIDWMSICTAATNVEQETPTLAKAFVIQKIELEMSTFANSSAYPDSPQVPLFYKKIDESEITIEDYPAPTENDKIQIGRDLTDVIYHADTQTVVDVWTKVTDPNDIEAGNYLIVSRDADHRVFDGAKTTNFDLKSWLTSTIENDCVAEIVRTDPEDEETETEVTDFNTVCVQLSKIDDTYWNIKCASGDYYIGSNGKNKLNVKTSADLYHNQFVLSDGVIQILCSEATTVGSYIRLNASGNFFRYYGPSSTGMEYVDLYKHVSVGDPYKWDLIARKDDLGEVAFSNSYDDLDDQPLTGDVVVNDYSILPAASEEYSNILGRLNQDLYTIIKGDGMNWDPRQYAKVKSSCSLEQLAEYWNAYMRPYAACLRVWDSNFSTSSASIDSDKKLIKLGSGSSTGNIYFFLSGMYRFHSVTFGVIPWQENEECDVKVGIGYDDTELSIEVYAEQTISFRYGDAYSEKTVTIEYDSDDCDGIYILTQAASQTEVGYTKPRCLFTTLSFNDLEYYDEDEDEWYPYTSQRIQWKKISSDPVTYSAGENISIDGTEISATGYKFNSSKHNFIEGDLTNNTATANYTHAEGYNTHATGDYAHAEGSLSLASGWHSHAEGSGTIASSTCAHAEGASTKANGEGSHSEGFSDDGSTRMYASGIGAHVEGYLDNNNYHYATGTGSHAEGYNTRASNTAAHAEGYNTSASGGWSHAEGQITQATANCAHSEGYNTSASGYCSHALGYCTYASGEASNAEGHLLIPYKNSSGTISANTYASGKGSHSEGNGILNPGFAAHVLGIYNIEDTTTSTFYNANISSALGIKRYAHIVGNGAGDTGRSNAETLDWAGNLWTQTDMMCGGTDMDAPTHKLSEKQNAVQIINLL